MTGRHSTKCGPAVDNHAYVEGGSVRTQGSGGVTETVLCMHLHHFRSMLRT